MALEIELKAHVENPEGLEKQLSGLGESLGTYEKDDTYWFPVKNGVSGLPASGVRVRREKTVDPRGQARGNTFVTYKIKELRGNIEVNDEREFEVSQGEIFGDLLLRLGLEPAMGKRKRGRAWQCGEIRAELSEVEGLGRFLELEIVTEKEGPGVIDESRKRLLEMLADLDIPPGRIETRPYTEMLRAKTHRESPAGLPPVPG